MDGLNKIGQLGGKKAFSFISEFKDFAFKGNLIDMAVGVIIGGAFGKLLDSFVKNVIMPAVSLVMPGEQGYVDWKLTIGEKTIPYGLFLGEIVSFLLIALVLFIFMVKIIGWFTRTKEEEVTAPAPLTKDQELLSEIRDLLSKNSTASA